MDKVESIRRKVDDPWIKSCPSSQIIVQCLDSFSQIARTDIFLFLSPHSDEVQDQKRK